MSEPDRRRSWVPAALLVGLVYLVVGVVTAELARSAATHRGVVTWRFAAWLTSAVAFALHIGHEHFRRQLSPRSTASHAAAAAAIGACALAAAAIVHALSAAPPHPRPRLLALALVAWPALTAVPAFLVALAVAWLLTRLKSR